MNKRLSDVNWVRQGRRLRSYAQLKGLWVRGTMQLYPNSVGNSLFSKIVKSEQESLEIHQNFKLKLSVDGWRPQNFQPTSFSQWTPWLFTSWLCLGVYFCKRFGWFSMFALAHSKNIFFTIYGKSLQTAHLLVFEKFLFAVLYFRLNP